MNQNREVHREKGAETIAVSILTAVPNESMIRVACEMCGAMIPAESLDRHRYFHRELAEDLRRTKR